MSEVSSSAAVDRDTQYDRALRAINELNGRMIAKDGTKYDPDFVIKKVQEIFDRPRPRNFRPYTLDDRIKERPDVLGRRMTDGILRTSTIIRFRHLANYDTEQLMDISRVGTIGVRKIREVLEAQGMTLKGYVDPLDFHANYRLVIPRGNVEAGKSYAWVPLGDHVDIDFRMILIWIGFRSFMPRGTVEPRLQTFGDMMALSRTQLEEIMFNLVEDKFESFNDERDRIFARDTTAKLKAYVDSTEIPWPAYDS